MGSRSVMSAMVKPPRPWKPKELDAPGPWESECQALRASLRDMLSEVNRLGLIVSEKEPLKEINRLGLIIQEKDAVIAGLMANLEEARKQS